MLSKNLSITPFFPHHLSNPGFTLQQMGRLELALDSYSQALDLNLRDLRPRNFSPVFVLLLCSLNIAVHQFCLLLL